MQRRDLIEIDDIDADDAALYFDAPRVPPEPVGFFNPPGNAEPPTQAAPKFTFERWNDIKFEATEEWLVKGALPRQGVGVIYGKSQSFKSFVALYIAAFVAAGLSVAERRTKQASVVYIAAEGANGLRKRKAGLAITHRDLGAELPFSLCPVAPNLGSEKGDLHDLITAVENEQTTPGLIVIDTLAQTLGAGDENGSGMSAFLINATALAQYFGALVLVVHHVGLQDDQRLRGWSGLNCGIDVQILCEREGQTFDTTLTVQKLKDEASNIAFKAHLSRIVLAYDEDSDEISTLVVDAIENAEPKAQAARTTSIPKNAKLFMRCVNDAINEEGKQIRAYSDGPLVRAVALSSIKKRVYARVAGDAEAGEDKQKIYERKKAIFRRGVEEAETSERIFSATYEGESHVWLP